MRDFVGGARSVRAAQVLFFLNAAIWLAFGVWSLVRLGRGSAHQTLTLWIVAILMFGNVGAMLLSGVGLGSRQRRFFWLAVAVLAVNIVLTVTDEFGIFDALTLALDLALLGLLVAGRKQYAAPVTRTGKQR